MKVFVTTDNHGTLNMRVQPTRTSAILAQIPYGTELAAETVNADWSKIQYKGKEGYVMTKFLSTELFTNTTITKSDLQRIYNSLKSTLQLIEEVLK